MTDHVKTDLDAGVLTLTLNRPDKRNAITDAMYAAMAEALDAAGADPATRVVLLRAEGDVFSGGNDIGDFMGQRSQGVNTQDLSVFRFLKALAHFEKPIVAAVKGVAVGIGTTALLHADLVFVAEDAKLSTPFVNLGLAPEAASSLLLPARIGYTRAFAMFALGDVLDGKTAAAWGLANAALPADQVEQAAREAAIALTKRPSGSLIVTKRLMRDAEMIWSVMREEGAVFHERLQSPEAAEAFTAFVQRRAPDFSNVG
ncbi:MAG TPA: enoyl-CoA hydratase-related protein [Caulobacteraceae bacterium]|jgi:enoyl-CoA hydratase/carnithine racemase|nr:enoyl-CoA hydratase-related protein [Caulobacteraceae bacterium]